MNLKLTKCRSIHGVSRSDALPLRSAALALLGETSFVVAMTVNLSTRTGVRTTYAEGRPC